MGSISIRIHHKRVRQICQKVPGRFKANPIIRLRAPQLVQSCEYQMRVASTDLLRQPPSQLRKQQEDRHPHLKLLPLNIQIREASRPGMLRRGLPGPTHSTVFKLPV